MEQLFQCAYLFDERRPVSVADDFAGNPHRRGYGVGRRLCRNYRRTSKTGKSNQTEWNCFNDSDDATLNAGGLGTMYAKDGKLYYQIEEISSLDYGNKIFVNKIHLEAGGLYKIKFTMKADRDVKCWFILNKYKDYDPRISEVFDLGAEAKTFEFTTSQEIVIGTDFELVFSFGATYNEAGAHPVLIEFSDVEIFKLT